MANNIKTTDFLPEVFRTDTNRKFLNATLDQLVSEPKFKKVNGYIGRKFAPTYQATDDYIKEINIDRQNYQLEPAAVVVDPDTDTVEFYGNYVDMVNIIKYYGGKTGNHSRLFSGDMYSYDSHFDFDKFVNFSQYYWLPDGPDAVTVSASGVPLEYTWDVTVDAATGAYTFSDTGPNNKNPNLVLAHGGKYKFNITDSEFWIQAKSSFTGVDPSFPNINVRSVLGVENNGASTGTVSFNVPQFNGQLRFTGMPVAQTVDYATTLDYRDLQGALQTEVISKFGGIDGVITGLNNKKIIFVDSQLDDEFWSSYIVDQALATELGDILQLNDRDAGVSSPITIPESLRTNVWVIYVDQDGYISLNPSAVVNSNEQVYVNSGNQNATRSYYIDYLGHYVAIPLITAPLSTLYYQNALSGRAAGLFSIVEPSAVSIDPSTDIIGRSSYVSPSGVIFTNGLKIKFDSTAGSFSNTEYFVEGVGTSIQLIAVSGLVAAELGDSSPDYLTINRGSIDSNAWSRSNRWFHIDILSVTAGYNTSELILDQAARANRPIIEFSAGLKLFNHGAVSKGTVDILDTTITDAYQVVENSVLDNPISAVYSVGSQRVTLTHGDRVIFSADTNALVSSKIYTFEIVNNSADNFINTYVGIIRETADPVILAGHSVLVKNVAKSYWYNGVNWVLSQQKTILNQAPLFDVFSSSGVGFGDNSTYVNSTFQGTSIFSYRQGTGKNDTVLGFPLSYRTFNNVGDIQFNNNFDVDQFSYLVGASTLPVAVSTGYLHITKSLSEVVERNIWQPAAEQSKQYQVITYVADGVSNLFEIDVLPAPSTDLPNIKVLINSRTITVNDFGLARVGARLAVLVNPDMLAPSTTVDILLYSGSSSALSYYQVPQNMDVNPLNQKFDSLTLGQMRNHLGKLAENSQLVLGPVPGSSNLRDLNVKSQGGTILRHAAPAVYADLFLVDGNMNFMESIRLAQREYSRFKNKILEISTRVEVNVQDIAGTLDEILSTINAVKNNSFSWFHSDMLPWGFNKNVLPAYTVFDPRIRTYELTTRFDDTILSALAVLIYITKTVNGKKTTQLLTKGLDYEFSKLSPSFAIHASYNLNYGDILTVVEYSSTDGNYLPETPTKLGLHPSFLPKLYLDDTYSNPMLVIQGHDGSITPSFGDYRDDLLLEFELRIYNNLKQPFANQHLYDQQPGKFRITDYSLTEYNEVLTSSFLTWAGANRVDFTNNKLFQSNNPLTWNYKNFRDTINAEFLPGAWRAVFHWLFDTDRPNTHPWEMLGFSGMPDWWVARYGVAPYTGGNLLLWSELSLGYIHAGPRAGISSAYARPGLLTIIPVDDSGNLLSPEKFCVIGFSSLDANVSFAVGDQGPVETAWRRSSDYPYALQQAQALTRPAEYFSHLVNVDRFKYDALVGQYLVTGTNSHLTPTQIEINGRTDDTGEIQRTAGYINWICENLKNTGIADPQDRIKRNLKNLDVLLSYKASGFLDKGSVKILAEQGSPTSTNTSVIVPDENYRIQLYKSVPVAKLTYSAVIVEKSQNGYTVSGYSMSDPYFIIVPSIPDSSAYTVTSGKLTGIIYKNYEKVRVRVPYGFEFTSQQEVVDFLVSYQRQLQSVGFVFNDFDYDLVAKQDWVLSAREFLQWSQQGWRPGNVIILSPVNQSIKVVSTDSVVDEITSTPVGSKMLDPNFQVIKKNNFTVLRVDNQFSVTTIKPQTIAYAELNMVQYEHVLIFDNRTVFNDIIYNPGTGNRQYRLKLVGIKTADWSGALNPSGFVYNDSHVDDWQPGIDYKRGDLVTYKTNYYVALTKLIASDLFIRSSWKRIDRNSIKTGMLPNFATNAKQFESFYDVDNQPIDPSFNFYSNGLIGFRERGYLTDLALDIETQVKFYQGYIKQKGTKNAILALARAQVAGSRNLIELSEEWAVRVGEYGALDSNRYVELILPESSVTSNPAPVQLIANSQVPSSTILQYKIQDLYQASANTVTDIFEVYKSAADRTTLPTAGYVNIDDVDATAYDLTDFTKLADLLPRLVQGFTIWCAKDFQGHWNVFRASETGTNVMSIAYSIDNIASVTTNRSHTLRVGDVIAIKQLDSRFDGFYSVNQVTGGNTFSIVLRANYTALRSLISLSGSGVLFKLSSMVVDNITQINDIQPLSGWNDQDRVWVNNDNAAEQWATYVKSTPWTSDVKILMDNIDYRGQDQFGASVQLSDDGLTMYAGAPGSDTGRAAIFTRITGGDWYENSNFTSTSSSTRLFGSAISANDKTFIVAAPASNNNDGRVFVYNINQSDGITLSQVLTVPGAIGGRFGYSLSSSQDGNWLYVGSPGNNQVHVYAWTNLPILVAPATISGDGITSNFTLPAGFANNKISTASDVLVTGNFGTLIPDIEYQITGSTDNPAIEFTVAPIPGSNTTVAIHSRYQESTMFSGTGEFGHSVKSNTTGDLVLVGAPGANISSIYSRVSEGFRATGITNSTFTVSRPISESKNIYINDILQTEKLDYDLVGNSIYFTSTLPSGVLVTVETTEFALVQELSQGYDQKFGQVADLIAGDIIAVSSPAYSTTNYASGAVSIFFNYGLVYNEAQGTVVDPVINPGDSIFINGVEIIFSTATLLGAVNSINLGNLPGVLAEQMDGTLKINGVNSLNILPGRGNALQSLGIEVYQLVQDITHPYADNTEHFGTTVKLSDAGGQLLVGSVGAAIFDYTIFDRESTTYDSYSTYFNDQIGNTGAVYVYQLLQTDISTVVDQYAFTQQLRPEQVGSDFNFGSSIDTHGGTIVVGATNDSAVLVNGGSVFSFTANPGSQGWSLGNAFGPLVEPLTIDKIYIYNTVTEKILSRLDFIDPVKGKILGIAQQDIDFMVEADPAIYNNQAPGATFHWTDQQMGKIWWDTSSMRYLNYEQGDIVYRNAHWGELFPGSVISVYEWVSSAVLPSQYITTGGNGVPRNTDNSKYVAYTRVDASTGMFSTMYYFWVSGKTSVSVEASKVNSVSAISRLISNPKEQGISYAAAISTDAISLFNVASQLTASQVAVHISYSPVNNTDIIHSEYELISENSATVPVPTRIVDKLQDSLAGLDRFGLIVPDPTLRPVNRTGISIRPRQGMFVNRQLALENFVKFCNNVFLLYPIVDQTDLSILGSQELTPAFSLGQWAQQVGTYAELTYIDLTLISDGHTVLINSDERYYDAAYNTTLWTINQWSTDTKSWSINKIQSYNTNLYWKKVDWCDATFDVTVKPTHTVDYFYQIEKLSLAAGDTVRLNDNGAGRFAYYGYDGTTITLRCIQAGTIQLSSTIYDLASGNMGFDNDNFDTIRFDQTPNQEVRYIIESVYRDIFVGQLKIEFNTLFFSLVNYIFSEQQSTDWIFKTSFVNVLHKIRDLAQYPSYKRDNTDYYRSYIDEVKPYRTQVREYVPVYPGADPAHVGATDFDLPGYFDAVSGTFRSPDGTYASDSQTLQSNQYADWTRNHTFSVTGVEVITGGTGYSLVPTVTISGGGGTGALAVALIDISTGAITSIQLKNAGSGYTSTPMVTVNGNGTGAVLSAKLRTEYFSSNVAMSYNAPRSITTELKFDRISYTSNMVTWSPNTEYQLQLGGDGITVWVESGDLVTHQGLVYQPLAGVSNSEPTFDAGLYQLVSAGNVLLHNNDRVSAYYAPGIGMPVKDLSILVDGIDYPGTQVLGAGFQNFTSNLIIGGNISFFNANSSIVSTDKTVNFIELGYQLNQTIRVYGSDLNDTNFGIVNFTSVIGTESTASPYSMIVDTNTVSNEFNSVNLTFGYTDFNDVNTLDSVVSSDYLDSALGTRPQDILVQGGAYVDLYASHAPQEMIPGRMFDALNISVYTQLDSGTVGYRISHNMQTNPAVYIDEVTWNITSTLTDAQKLEQYTAKNTVPKYFKISDSETTVNRSTSLTQALYLTDTLIHVVNAALISPPDSSVNRPGVVYINGERITFWSMDLKNHTLGNLRRGTDGTGAPAVHPVSYVKQVNTFVNGQIVETTMVADVITDVVDGSDQQELPDMFRSHTTSWLNTFRTANYIVDNNNNFLVDNFEASIIDVQQLASSTLIAGASVLPSDIVDNQGNVVVDNFGTTIVASIPYTLPSSSSVSGLFVIANPAVNRGQLLTNVAIAYDSVTGDTELGNWVVTDSSPGINAKLVDDLDQQLGQVGFDSAILDGSGLSGSRTPQAVFLKN
jgi:hypothetical protein